MAPKPSSKPLLIRAPSSWWSYLPCFLLKLGDTDNVRQGLALLHRLFCYLFCLLVKVGACVWVGEAICSSMPLSAPEIQSEVLLPHLILQFWSALFSVVEDFWQLQHVTSYTSYDELPGLGLILLAMWSSSLDSLSKVLDVWWEFACQLPRDSVSFSSMHKRAPGTEKVEFSHDHVWWHPALLLSACTVQQPVCT